MSSNHRLSRFLPLGFLFLLGAATLAAEASYRTTFVANDLKGNELFWREYRQVVLEPDERDVPSQLPGPADGWAGEGPKEIVLPLPYRRPTTLTLSLYDSHESAPPVLAVLSGGKEVARIAVAPGNGKGMNEWKREGRPSSYEALVPAAAGPDPHRQVTLTPVSGSWVAVATVTLSPVRAWWEFWRWLPPSAALALTGGAPLLALLFWLVSARREGRMGEALGNGALLLFSTAATLAAGELLLARWYPQPDFSAQRRIVYEADRGAGYRLKPSVRTRLGFDTNRLGMRDYDRYTRSKPAGVYRILALGDSQTFSWTALPDSFPKRLEALLNGAGKNVEVLNAGVPGYGNDDEYFYLDAYGPSLAPDLALVAVYVGNDLIENGVDHDYTVVDGAKVKVELAKTLSEKELTFRKRLLEILSESQWYRLASRFRWANVYDTLHAKDARDLRERMNEVKESCIRATDHRFHHLRSTWESRNYGGSMATGWNRTASFLGKMAAWAESRHARFMVALIPVEAQLETPEALAFRNVMAGQGKAGVPFDWDEPQKSLVSLAAEKGWPVVDLLPAMREAGGKERLYYCNDIHLNEAGSALAARTVADALTARWPDLADGPAAATVAP